MKNDRASWSCIYIQSYHTPVIKPPIYKKDQNTTKRKIFSSSFFAPPFPADAEDDVGVGDGRRTDPDRRRHKPAPTRPERIHLYTQHGGESTFGKRTYDEAGRDGT